MFDRRKSYGKRLDKPAGTAFRFEPGIATVTLVSIGGNKIISGGNSLATGKVDLGKIDGIMDELIGQAFGDLPEPDAPFNHIENYMSREQYISMFGPTKGDRVRLGDTALWIEVEFDKVRVIVIRSFLS